VTTPARSRPERLTRHTASHSHPSTPHTELRLEAAAHGLLGHALEVGRLQDLAGRLLELRVVGDHTLPLDLDLDIGLRRLLLARLLALDLPRLRLHFRFHSLEAR